MAVREVTINLPALMDGTGTPLTGFDQFELIGIPAGTFVTVDGAEEIVSTIIKKPTASDGTNSFSVIAPLDMTPSDLKWKITRDVGRSNTIFITTSFAWRSSPYTMTDVIPGSGGTGARATMTNRVLDGAGIPIEGMLGQVRPSTDFFDSTTGENILSSAFVDSTSDSAGNLSWPLVPLSHSDPPVYWIYYDSINGAVEQFTVPDAGGTIYGNRFSGPLGGVTSPAFNPMSATDDLIVGGVVTAGVAAPNRLGKGADGQVLTVDPITHHLLWKTPSALANPMTTPADLIVGGTSGAPARLGKGSDGQVLTVNPSTHLLAWSTPSPGFLNPMTALDDLMVGGASGAATRLPKGADGSLLTVDTSSHHVTWDTPVSIDSDAAGIPAFNVVEQSSTPSTPAAGHAKLYVKTDHLAYIRDSSGTETAVGGGGGGGGSLTAWVMKTADFTIPSGESKLLADTTSADITFTLPDGTGAACRITCKKFDTSANVLHIDTVSGQTIEFAPATYDITLHGHAVTLVNYPATGNWYIE